MSFVISSLHPPSIISSVATANIGYDALILSRGNEVLISEITNQNVSKPKIYPFFGNIISICSFDSNKLAILFETEKLLLFEILPDHLHCFSQCSFDYKVGRKVPKSHFSASNSLIICHTRFRTIQIIIPEGSLSFSQYLQLNEIYAIKCFDNTMQFIIFGKNLSNNYQVVLYEIEDKKVNQIKSISFPECDLKPSILIDSIDKFYISINDQIEICSDFNQKNLLYSHTKKIASLFQINRDMIALCDIKNKIFNISTQNEMLTLEGIDEIIPIGHGFFFELSSDEDSHLLKYENSILKIVDTFAQLNCTCFMDRSQLITKSGIIRTFVNGCATVNEITIDIDCGKLIWYVLNKFIIISTFNSTIVLENKKFEQVEMKFLIDCETLSIIQTIKTNSIIQITPEKIRILSFSDENDENPAFSDIPFDSDKAAIQVASCGNNFIVAFSDNSISFYTFSEDDSKLNCNSTFSVQHEVSAMAMTDSCLSVSFWNDSKIQTFNLESCEIVNQISIENGNEVYVSSLIYENENENSSLIAGCSNGDLFIFNFEPENKEKYEMVKIHVSNSSMKLKRIKNQILIVSDVSAFLHKQIKQSSSEEEEKEEICEYKIEFISVSASFDATEILSKIGFLCSKGVVILSIESNHHSHIEDRTSISNKITLISVDETNHCPIVYSIKSSSKGGADTYALFASGLQPFKLGLEIPRSMIWFFHDSSYYLIVGCEFEKSGRILVFNSKLEKLSEVNLSHPVDAMCSVLNEYIAVASGKSLMGYILNQENNLVRKCSVQTRKKCASLTSPNSIAVVYADKVASASIYKMCDDQVVLIASDMNPKALKFARLESETDVLAIGDNSIIYDLSLTGDNKLKTKAAFNINCDVNAVFCSPNLAFITKSGSMQVILKMDKIFIDIFRVMAKNVHGLGGLSINEFRTVKINDNSYSIGNFVDGDFVRLFENLSLADQNRIAKIVGVDAAVIKKHIKDYVDKLIAYREKSQMHPRF